MRWFRRLNLIRRAKLLGDTSELLLSSDSDCYSHRSSQIIVEAGLLRIGHSHRPTSPFSAYRRTIISLGPGAKIICKGPVLIGPGVTIQVGANAELLFGGNNTLAHNCIILANKRIELGRGSALSWNCTLIDDDGHDFKNSDGKVLRKLYHPLIIGEDVGIQMNVVIPRGVTIGSRSVISANTVLRQDIPERCLVYQKPTLEIKRGIGAHFADEDN